MSTANRSAGPSARVRAVLSSLAPGLLGGGMFVMAFARALDPQASRLGTFLLGAAVGVVVLLLIRLFPVARWAYPFAGLLAAPFLLFLLPAKEGDRPGERAGAWLLVAVLGLLIGLLEWARAGRAEALAARSEDREEPLAGD